MVRHESWHARTGAGTHSGDSRLLSPPIGSPERGGEEHKDRLRRDGGCTSRGHRGSPPVKCGGGGGGGGGTKHRHRMSVCGGPEGAVSRVMQGLRLKHMKRNLPADQFGMEKKKPANLLEMSRAHQ